MKYTLIVKEKWILVFLIFCETESVSNKIETSLFTCDRLSILIIRDYMYINGTCAHKMMRDKAFHVDLVSIFLSFY